MSPRSSAMRERITWLDGVRGGAALFVVLHHIWLHVWPQFPDDAGPSWLGWLLYGHLAVAVFIVVSGFSLSLAPLRDGGRLRGGLSRFIERRAWRIIPPYWAALVLSTIVSAVILHHYGSPAAVARAFMVHGLLLQDIVGSHPPNGAFWSIAIEWQIYFVFPVILLVARARGLAIAVALTVAVVLVAHLVGAVGSPFDRINRLMPQFLALFALGILAVRVGRRADGATLRRWLLGLAGVVMVAVVAGALLQGSRWMVARYYWVDLLFGLAAACVLAALLGGQAAPARRVLASRPARKLGLFSYSLYLMHTPVLALIFTYLVRPLDLKPIGEFWLLLTVGLPTTLVVSYGFHLLFEAPFLRHRGLEALRTMPFFGAALRRPAPAVPAPVELAAASEDA